MIQFVSLAIVVSVIPWSPVARPLTTALLVAATLLTLLVAYGSLEVLGGGSAGKRALKLGVRMATGDRAGRGRLALRWLIKVFPITAFFALAYANDLWRLEWRPSPTARALRGGYNLRPASLCRASRLLASVGAGAASCARSHHWDRRGEGRPTMSCRGRGRSFAMEPRR